MVASAVNRFRKRIDGLADDATARIQRLTGETLATAPDPVLQALVLELAEGLQMPMTLVSLALSRTQYFRAHHGLPPDLAIARATDRDASFCQFVVRDTQRFEVTNATDDDRVPTDLVERYGARAYIGQPIFVTGEAVGALCAIDASPREFTDGDRALIARLAERVSARLEELAVLRTSPPAALLTRAAQPAFSELRNIVGPLEGNITMARIALTDLGGLVRLVTQLSPEDIAHTPAYGVLDSAVAAFDDLTAIVGDLERCAQRLLPMLQAIERLTLGEREHALLADVVTTAGNLAHHHTKLIGGVRWAPMRPDLEIGAARVVAVAVVAATLSVMAAALKGRATGFDVDVELASGGVRMAFRAARLDDATLAACAAELQQLIGASGTCAVTAAPGGLALWFPSATRSALR